MKNRGKKKGPLRTLSTYFLAAFLVAFLVAFLATFFAAFFFAFLAIISSQKLMINNLNLSLSSFFDKCKLKR